MLDPRSIRQEEFVSQWWGYARDEVDVFLESVAVSVESEWPIGPLFSSVEFRRSARGYDRKQVDSYLRRILSEVGLADPAAGERGTGTAQWHRNSQRIAEDADRNPPNDSAIIGPVNRTGFDGDSSALIMRPRWPLPLHGSSSLRTRLAGCPRRIRGAGGCSTSRPISPSQPRGGRRCATDHGDGSARSCRGR